MDALAVVLAAPETLALNRLPITEPGEADIAVAVEWSGISTGTERLLWSGRMPDFPGMGYPLVPGYEAVGRVERAGPRSGVQVGERVFVPGARCFGEVRGLFGAAASRLVVPGARAVLLGEGVGEQGVLLALAATARHALAPPGSAPGAALPDLIVGHGTLGRLLARLAVLEGVRRGHPPPGEHHADEAHDEDGDVREEQAVPSHALPPARSVVQAEGHRVLRSSCRRHPRPGATNAFAGAPDRSRRFRQRLRA